MWQSGWLCCRVVAYRWERSAGVLIANWLTVKDCAFVPFLFQSLWIFCWTLLKELCLKTKGLGTRPRLPNPLNHFSPGKTSMPACCWHIDMRTLACLPIILCKQIVWVLCLLSLPGPPPPIINNFSLEGSSQPQVKDSTLWCWVSKTIWE